MSDELTIGPFHVHFEEVAVIEKKPLEQPKKQVRDVKIMSVKIWPRAHRGYGAITMKWE